MSGPFSEKMVSNYACQILKALEYFHTKDIALMELDPEEIYIKDDGTIKINPLREIFKPIP